MKSTIHDLDTELVPVCMFNYTITSLEDIVI